MKSYRHSIAVPIGLLLIAAVMVLPWDAKISEWFHQDKFPGDLEKILDLAETFAHGIGIGAIAPVTAAVAHHAISDAGQRRMPRSRASNAVSICRKRPANVVFRRFYASSG